MARPDPIRSRQNYSPARPPNDRSGSKSNREAKDRLESCLRHLMRQICHLDFYGEAHVKFRVEDGIIQAESIQIEAVRKYLPP